MKLSKIILSVIMVVFVFSASGCVRVLHVKVDSIGDSTVTLNKVYQILPGNKDTGSNDLQFKEFAGQLVKVLSIQGYTLSSAVQPAELEIYLSYGVGEPEKHTYSYSVPVYGQTGTGVYTVTSQINSPDNSSTTQYSATQVQPQYGVTGFTEQTGEYTSYRKYVILDAYDIKNGRPGSKLTEVWKTSISASGKMKDLRKIYPVLLGAAEQYIGLNTGGEIGVDMPTDSPVIKAIKAN